MRYPMATQPASVLLSNSAAVLLIITVSALIARSLFWLYVTAAVFAMGLVSWDMCGVKWQITRRKRVVWVIWEGPNNFAAVFRVQPAVKVIDMTFSPPVASFIRLLSMVLNVLPVYKCLVNRNSDREEQDTLNTASLRSSSVRHVMSLVVPLTITALCLIVRLALSNRCFLTTCMQCSHADTRLFAFPGIIMSKRGIAGLISLTGHL